MSVQKSATISRKRQRDNDAAGPAKKLRRSSEETDDGSDDKGIQRGSLRAPTKHTKQERKKNRSSRIHSLRKLLARSSLPSTIRQEKERELAALLHDQGKAQQKKQAKKVLEKYHYVRFIERQKAEKRLKQLRKQAQAEGEDEELSKKIHEMEVSRNYAIYAPLDQKYVSVFVPKTQGDEEEENVSQDPATRKPEMWHVVRELMAQGQSQLEALRDGSTKEKRVMSDEDNNVQHSAGRSAEKLDRRKRKLPSQHLAGDKKGQHQAIETSDDEDVIDGGFFER
ncbi:rRNA-processing protein efg1 [Lithohypha guttulata]|uniref:rRNA-processing protein efg1 n=1 Tax=Lithohypha guttulata TaxID=1690604 RepID=UPI002DE19E5E|nr:rRNA-processing protein efg1 [Lithohypha guttulata]